MADLGETFDAVRRHASAIVQAASRAVEEVLKRDAPRGQTSELGDSIIVTFIDGDPPGFEVEVGSSHAGFVFFGTQPHAITPHRPPRALHFNGSFAAVVRHPGNLPREQYWSDAINFERYREAVQDAADSMDTQA